MFIEHGKKDWQDSQVKVKAGVVKTDNLNSIPRAHMGTLWSLNVHPYTHTHTFNFKNQTY